MPVTNTRPTVQQATQTLQSRGVISAEQATQLQQAAQTGQLSTVQQQQLGDLAAQADRFENSALQSQVQQFLPQAPVTQGTRTSPLQTLIGQSIPRGAEQLLKDILANFAALEAVTPGDQLIGVRDIRTILANPAAYPKELVELAGRISKQENIFELVDWTGGATAVYVHDRASQKCEFERALAIVQDKKALSDAVTYLVNNYDKVSANNAWGFILEKDDFAKEIDRLAVGNPKERKIAETLQKSFGKAGEPVGPVDVWTLLASASGNNSPTEPQFLTLSGMKLFKDIINSRTPERLAPIHVDGRPNRKSICEDLAKNFDAMRVVSARDNVAYVGPGDVVAILDNPSKHPPELVKLARTLSRNMDLLDLASQVEYAGNNGRPGNDRIATGPQFAVVASLMEDAPAVTAALDHLLDNLETIGAREGHQTLEKPELLKEIERLKNGTPQERAIGATLSRSWGNNWANMVQLLASASGNNDPTNVAITREGLIRLRNVINKPLPGSRPPAATTVDFRRDDFADTRGLVLNGTVRDLHKTPTVVDGKTVLRLTNNTMQGSTAFIDTPIALGKGKDFNFSTHFEVNMNGAVGYGDADGPGADGMTLVLSPDPKALGGIGGGLGVYGLKDAVYVELDTYFNPASDGVSDVNGNHVAIHTGAQKEPVATAPVAGRFNDGRSWNVWVDYNGETGMMEVRINASRDRPANPTISAPVDLEKALGGKQAFVGLSAATGAGMGNQDVQNWSFKGPAVKKQDPVQQGPTQQGTPVQH